MPDIITRSALAARLLCTATFSIALTACGGGDGKPATPGTSVSPVTTYAIGGTVSGLTTGQSVTVALNGGQATVVNGPASGTGAVPFSFGTPVSAGSSYAVTVSSISAGTGALSCQVSNGSGTVSANVSNVAVACQAPQLTTLYAFTGSVVGTTGDGFNPRGRLIMDSMGNLFGTTEDGGAGGSGTLFELTPNASGGYTKTVLYTFLGGSDGSLPSGGLVMDSQGNLFGSASLAGAYGSGTVFELKSTGAGTYASNLTTLYSFHGGSSDGGMPNGDLVIDNAGNLFGTTWIGGPGGGGLGYGAVFELKSTGAGTYATSVTVLYFFQGGSDGSSPNGGLFMDSAGNLFGTTSTGSGIDDGKVFELKSAGAGIYATNVTTLYSFQGGSDGYSPNGGLIIDSQGNLLGTTNSWGGSVNTGGTVFELKSTGAGTYASNLTTLYAFQTGSGGSTPFAGLIMDREGNLFGTTVRGGNGLGTIFEVKSTGVGTYAALATQLHAFIAGEGSGPYAALLMNSQGSLFGTTSVGGGSGRWGTVFELN
ncbi:hypothetical protein LMG27952_04885 [Paraburkholderia hiiakae]|uniref:Gloeo_Verruco repeat-containing protein n=1 Tax=Paraburkholderia hiiakae TaxID=1081782 RepID=A0ABN7I2B6_9BURK|nr:choice-of-anchor tandem repeat GloVer-containing protein [Paraburkholderia hiiakae]CAD6549711.1 hypothetical protein LMG27952_04885 [Paraburkholderia hiiakae]